MLKIISRDHKFRNRLTWVKQHKAYYEFAHARNNERR